MSILSEDESLLTLQVLGARRLRRWIEVSYFLDETAIAETNERTVIVALLAFGQIPL